MNSSFLFASHRAVRHAACLKRWAAIFMLILAIQSPCFAYERETRVGNISSIIANTALAVWSYNAAWNAKKAHTRDFGRAMTIWFTLGAVIRFGGAISQ